MNLSDSTVARYMGAARDRISTPRGSIVAREMVEGISNTFAVEPRLIEVTKGVYCYAGGSISIRTMIDAPEGLVIFDTGDDIEDGERALAAFRTLSDKPVRAIIYSHNHYAHGTVPFLAGQDDVTIIGHALVNEHFKELATGFATGGDFPEAMPALTARFLAQFGSVLPESGPDSGFAGTIPMGKRRGTVPANRLVTDGEVLEVAGLRMQFFTEHFSDSEDTLTAWVPELGLVLNNFLWPSLFNFYTLRGDVWRNPASWRDGLRVIRDLAPAHLVNTHALPISGAESVREALDGYIGAISFLIDQTLRGINRGMGPAELREFVRLPKALAQCPHNGETYSEFSFFPPHLYHHVFGWFDGNAAHIHRLPPAEEARRIIAGFGGADAVAAQCRAAAEAGEALWALQLADYLLCAQPADAARRQLKADALREMAYRSPGTIARHFCLTEALALEGKVRRPVAVLPTVDDIVAADPARYVSFQRIRLDPDKACNAQMTLRLHIEDRARWFALAVRHGVAEFLADAAAERVPAHAELRLSHRTWAEFYVGKTTLAQALDSGAASTGDRAAVEAFFACFDAPVLDSE